MTDLHKLYGTGYGKENEKVYRNKLKARIVKEFGESLKFLEIDCKTWFSYVARISHLDKAVN